MDAPSPSGLTLSERMRHSVARVDVLGTTNQVPTDAGELHAVLADLVARIPAGLDQCFWIDAGWYALVAELNEELAALHSDYLVTHVKSSFGALSYGVGPGAIARDPRVKEILDRAAAESTTICERCGAPGHLRTHSSYVTACDAHTPAPNRYM